MQAFVCNLARDDEDSPSEPALSIHEFPHRRLGFEMFLGRCYEIRFQDDWLLTRVAGDKNLPGGNFNTGLLFVPVGYSQLPVIK